jgi:hypothetical protein
MNHTAFPGFKKILSFMNPWLHVTQTETSVDGGNNCKFKYPHIKSFLLHSLFQSFSTTDKPPIEQIPEEMLLAVFNCLGTFELLSPARVNRRWRRVSQDFSLWKKNPTLLVDGRRKTGEFSSNAAKAALSIGGAHITEIIYSDFNIKSPDLELLDLAATSPVLKGLTIKSTHG